MKKRQYAPQPASNTSVIPANNLLQTRPFQADINHDQQVPQARKESETLAGGFDLTKKQYEFNPPVTTTGQPIQAKLTIGQPNDKYEQEADRVAHDVVQQIHSAQTAETAPQTLAQRQEEAIQMKPLLQKKKVLERGEASPNLEASINQARGSGQPLDANLQRQMGQAMGADFSGVKVHTDSHADQLNRSIQAKAFTTGHNIFFKTGAYQPKHQEGQKLIAHELTHVQQQNQGININNPSTNTTDSTKFNLQRYVEVAQGAANQPRKKIKDGGGSRDATAIEANDYFVSQIEDVGGGFSDAQGNPLLNLQSNSDVPLLISDNNDMAIERGAEAKFFFATEKLITAANKKLKGQIQLRHTNKYLKISTTFSHKKLYQVEPVLIGADNQPEQTGLAVRTPQRCNEMAEFVSGSVGVASTAIVQANDILAQILMGTAAEADVDDYRNSLHTWQKTGQNTDKQRANDAMDAMVQQYKIMINDPVQANVLERKLSKMKINQFISPKVGQAIVTTGIYESNDPQPDFLYHFATVVAKSGNDYITMENYARGQNAQTASAGDPLFFFKMYGNSQPMQSWYEKQEASGDFQGAVLSFIVN